MPRIIISDATAYDPHADNIKASISTGYGSDISADIEIRRDFTFAQDVAYAESVGAVAIVCSLGGAGTFDATVLSEYPGILGFFPQGTNVYQLLGGSTENLYTSIASGAGDTQNRTSYGGTLEFWDTEIIDDGFQSSYSNGTVCGKLLKIYDGRGHGWWDARYAARMTASGGGLWTVTEGYGQINVTNAIASSDPTIDDPFIKPDPYMALIAVHNPPRPFSGLYKAILAQAGTAAPSATVLENSIGNPIWSRVDTGDYQLQLASAFPSGKTFIRVSFSNTGAGEVFQVTAKREDDNNVRLKTWTSAIAAVDVFTDLFFEIEIYP